MRVTAEVTISSDSMCARIGVMNESATVLQLGMANVN